MQVEASVLTECYSSHDTNDPGVTHVSSTHTTVLHYIPLMRLGTSMNMEAGLPCARHNSIGSDTV
jgi:hypothetical protein